MWPSVPQGQCYLSDSSNNCIRVIDAKTEQVDTFAGASQPGFAGDGGDRKNARFREPICITLTPDARKLLIADIRNFRIRQIDLATGRVETLAGTGKRGIPAEGAVARESLLLDPRAVAADSRGNVYILERAGHVLRMIDTRGRLHTVAGTGEKGFRDGPAAEAAFYEPKHICIDPQDRVYVSQTIKTTQSASTTRSEERSRRFWEAAARKRSSRGPTAFVSMMENYSSSTAATTVYWLSTGQRPNKTLTK